MEGYSASYRFVTQSPGLVASIQRVTYTLLYMDIFISILAETQLYYIVMPEYVRRGQESEYRRQRRQVLFRYIHTYLILVCFNIVIISCHWNDVKPTVQLAFLQCFNSGSALQNKLSSEYLLNITNKCVDRTGIYFWPLIKSYGSSKSRIFNPKQRL